MRIKLDIPIAAQILPDMLNSTACPNRNDYRIEYVSTDSRDLQSGDLFFALRGDNFNGEDYLADAKKAGAYTVGTGLQNTDFTVSDTKTSLSHLANSYKKLLNIKSCVAITGSVGKTTTKELTLKLLSTKFRTHGTYKNLNNEIGVPLTVLSAKKDTEILVIEAGMNHKGELQKISECIEPDISVITNIGTAHIGNLGSRKKIAEAKEEILCGMKTPYLLAPASDPYITRYPFLRTVSTTDELADFYLFSSDAARGALYGFRSRYNFIDGFEIGGNMPHIPICLSFALSVCSVLNMSNKELRCAVDSLDFGHYEKTYKIGTLTVIDDSYNCSLESAKSALCMLSKKTEDKKSAVFGDMLELGEFSDKLHFDLGMAISEARLSHLYLFGKSAKIVKEGAVNGGMSEDNIFINENISAPHITAEQIHENSNNETLLLKGSRGMRLERILEILKEY